MTDLLFVWAALALAMALVVIPPAGKGGALVLAYFFGLSLIHVPGALIFSAHASGLAGADETRFGFKVTMIGLIAFTGGALLGRIPFGPAAKSGAAPSTASSDALQALGLRALAVGAVAYFVLIPAAGSIPSLTSLVAGLATVLILGLWLRLYSGVVARNPMRVATTLALVPLLPMATLVSGGFLGFGMYWALSILCFLYTLSRRRWIYVAVSPVVMFMGLSLFVAYMGERTGIRDVVWNQQAGVQDRIDRVSTIFTKFKLLNLSDDEALAAINGRLNQNSLVGAGVIRHEAGAVGLSHGGTLQPWALIPRALWPNKPAVGGGREVVTSFTGIRFAEGTSVGAGQVLEFYMNFGMAGVVIGFVLLGFVLMRMDIALMSALVAGDIRKVLTIGMPGLTLLTPGGNLLEIMVALVAAYVVAKLLGVVPWFHVGRPRRAVAAPAGAPAGAASRG